MTTRGVRLLCLSVWFTVTALALPALAADAPPVRIARLSIAQGDVQIDRNVGAKGGEGWEQAINNMPLTQGARIYAAQDSKAEIELEDGSNIRLVGPAQISLDQLSFSPDGAPVTNVEVDSGLVYVNARLGDHAGSRTQSFRIQDPNGETFAIVQPSHLRFKVEEQVALLAVIDGEVEALSDGANVRIHGGQSYNYILGQPESAARLAKVIPEDEDAWDRQRDQYDGQYAAAGAQYSGSDSPDAYGDADLGYYGSYDNIPGYGESWQPAGVDSDWDPFDYGAWSYYPDWGWTFVSGYPWGWCPFYYGNWFYVRGRGWWWHPGPRHGSGGRNGNSGWHPRPQMAGAAPQGFTAPRPPAGSAHSTVAVAGSKLSVGPISVTHAEMARSSANHATATHQAGGQSAVHLRAGSASATVYRGAGSSGAASNVSRGAASLPPSITGRRGAYTVIRPSPDRSSYELHGSPASYSEVPREVPRSTYSGYAPRSYSYGGSPAPRSFSAPSAPPASSAPHVSGEGFSGGGFHSSGFSGGGGRR